jgi:alanine racemase
MRGVATISQSALLYNLSVVKKYAPQAKVVAMVKANAYGHQLDLVTPLLENADILAISEIKEAQKLRRISDKPILLHHD